MIILIVCILLWSIPMISSSRALLLVDIQVCYYFDVLNKVNTTYLDNAINSINDLRNVYGGNFSNVVRTTTSRCANHVSFKSQYNNTNLTSILLGYNNNGDLCNSTQLSFPYVTDCTIGPYTMTHQTLWPDYCVDSVSDATVSRLVTSPSDIYINKTSCGLEWYSGFFDNIKMRQSGLDARLKQNGITTVFIVGLALDTVVYYTALDAVLFGYRVFVIVPRDLEFSMREYRDLESNGVKIIRFDQVQESIQLDNSAFAAQAVRYKIDAPYITWGKASSDCSPYRLCTSPEICSNSNLLKSSLFPNSWLPSGDYPNAWVSLDNNNCTLNPFNASLISTPIGVPLMCCYQPDSSPQPTPIPQPPTPDPVPQTPPQPVPQTPPPQPVPDTPPPPQPVAPTPNPVPQSPLPQPVAPTPGTDNNGSAPIPRVHVDVPTDVSSPRQLARVGSIVAISLGAGFILGIAIGCLLGKKNRGLEFEKT